jgi:hypothetical protein
MDEFNFDDTNFDDTKMSTSINQLRKKKSEQDNDSASYANIRMKLYNDINAPPILQQNNKDILYRPIKNKKQNKSIKPKNKNFYFNIIIFSLIFFFVNNYYLNDLLILKKNSYYTIVFIKLVLFLVIYYIYKYFIN